jgi:thiol-disulfide isomerase/thioredoxin
MSKTFLAVLTACTLLLAAGCGDSASDVTGVVEAADGETPQPAPDFTLEAADGKQVKLSDYKGQVVLLNFWATWCGPCKIEMPWFIEFQRKYKDQGFTVLAVSLDEEGWDVVRPYAESLKPNFPILLGNDEIADRFDGVVALPTTLVINKEGQIVGRHTGLVNKSDYESEIEGLL